MLNPNLFECTVTWLRFPTKLSLPELCRKACPVELNFHLFIKENWFPNSKVHSLSKLDKIDLTSKFDFKRTWPEIGPVVIKEYFSFLSEIRCQRMTLEPLKPRSSLKLYAREGGQNNMLNRPNIEGLYANCSIVFHSSSKTLFLYRFCKKILVLEVTGRQGAWCHASAKSLLPICLASRIIWQA